MSRPFYARGYTMKICKRIIAENAFMIFEQSIERTAESLEIEESELKEILGLKDETDNSTKDKPSSGRKDNKGTSRVRRR